MSYSNSCCSSTTSPSGSPTPDVKVSSYTFETFCKNIDFGGFDTYKRERISGLQNVKMPTFLFSSNRELSGYRLRSRRRSPPRRAVCSGNAPSEKMSPQSERAPTKNRQQERPLAVSGKATARRAEGKLKKKIKNAHYTVAKKKITDNLCEGSKRRDGV